MSVTYENITDGQNVGTWAGNLNTFGNAVVDEFESVESDVTDLESSKISKTDTAVLFLTNVTPNPQTLTTTYAKVDMVDTVSINVSNGHISYDDVSKTITFVDAGIYEISFSGTVTAGNGTSITFNYNLNGSHLISNPPVFVGKGNSTPVPIENHLLIQVTAGAILFIEALAESSTTLTPLSSAFTIEKTPY